MRPRSVFRVAGQMLVLETGGIQVGEVLRNSILNILGYDAYDIFK